MRRYRKFMAVMCVVLTMALIFAGCGSKETEGTKAETKTEETKAKETTEADKEETTTVAKTTEEEAGSEVLDEIISAFEKETGAWTEWTGPTDGPKIAEGKTIAIINQDSSNGGEALWGDAVAEACEVAGWEYVIMDGQGDVTTEMSCFSQAIALGVDGIVTSANTSNLQASIEEAKEKGIPTVGIHASATVGPDEKENLLYNNTSDPKSIGHAIADYAIADSQGKGKVVIIYNANHSIASVKGEAMKERVEQAGMEVLEFYTIGDDWATTLPSKMASWISTYGDDFYVLCIADAFFDYLIPTIRNAGAENIQLIGSDGENAAYERIRKGEYQVATVPEPGLLFGYMCVDELNRYFNGEEQYVWSPQMHIVTKDNVDSEGGTDSVWTPGNNFQDHYKEIWGVQ
ncbi:substrate-binding domain-containing protein [Qiania dongpingensis]|uniref:Substrate-binding domain-containing protein n=1 Tax=Qiania dongpingensis TaxID=2763669 RepID=A0A7G9G6T0_9FIRM|nr:substrate-binding domain-containing protein [Qiania dongpingensis]QNM06512.1 substrate-binding domain-containing protein [Qiania dongpingensis]